MHSVVLVTDHWSLARARSLPTAPAIQRAAPSPSKTLGGLSTAREASDGAAAALASHALRALAPKLHRLHRRAAGNQGQGQGQGRVHMSRARVVLVTAGRAGSLLSRRVLECGFEIAVGRSLVRAQGQGSKGLRPRAGPGCPSRGRRGGLILQISLRFDWVTQGIREELGNAKHAFDCLPGGGLFRRLHCRAGRVRF